MKRISLLLATLITMLPMLVRAQATIPVSGQKVKTSIGQPLTGILRFTVTDASDSPVTYTVQGGSPSTAAIDVTVLRGAVQYTGGFPPQIPNPATMTPSNTRYRIQVCTAACGTVYFTLPYTNITLSQFSYDSYVVPPTVTVSGAGLPILPCTPTALYTNTMASDPYPWVCSLLPDSGSVYWTQNPSLNPTCAANNLAIATPIGGGAPFCLPSTSAFATPGFVLGSPATGAAGTVGLIPNTAGGRFPSTPGVVYNTSTTAARNAVFGDITNLWASGTCVGYLKNDGTCSIPGGSPSGTNLSFQINNGGSFSAGPVTTDSTFQQFFYAGGNVPVNGSGQYINQQFLCTPNAQLSLPAGQGIGQNICSNVQYYPRYPGWDMGNTPLAGAGMGVMNNHALEVSGRIGSAGIKATYFSDMNCDGAGDCTASDHVIRARGGCGVDVSCEGYGGQRYSIQELAEPTGTTGSVGTGLNILAVDNNALNQGNNGVEMPIYNPSYDVISTTFTGATADPSGNFATYNLVGSVPVSLQCSTVVSDVLVATMPANQFVTRTVTLNTNTDLSSAANTMLFSYVLPFIQTAKVLSTGTYNSGAHTQTINVNLNKSVAAGSKYCIGGMAGRGMEITNYTINGQVYLLDVIGSPTANTVIISSPGSQGPTIPVSPNGSAVNFFHKATIVDISVVNQFQLSDNDIAWGGGNGTTWVSPNLVNQIRYDILNLGLWNDPYTVDQGALLIKQGLSTRESQFLFLKNQSVASNFIGHGGNYPGPNLAVVYGVSNGVVFDAVPDTCFHSGNPCAPAFFSFGNPSAGTTTPTAIVASNRGGGDAEQFLYRFGDNSWRLTTGAAGNQYGYVSTDQYFQAGLANVAPTHMIEASGNSNGTTVGVGDIPSVYVENRNGGTGTMASLFLGGGDSFNQRFIGGGMSAVTVTNSHFGPTADLHVFVNNAGTMLDGWQFYHDGGMTSIGVTGGDMGAGSFNFGAGFLNGIALTAIANVAVAMPTTAIAANTCTTPATATMTGLATSSSIASSFATNPTTVTGWGSSGGLYFRAWPTANTLNWSVCNQTALSITPGAITLNVGAK